MNFLDPKKIALWAILTVLAALFLFPIGIIFTHSFMGGFEITNRYTHHVQPGNVFYAVDGIHFVRLSLIPDYVAFGQYIRLLFGYPRYLGMLWNSFALAVPIMLGQLFISAPAAYAFEMSRLRSKEALYIVYIVVMLMPLQVALVPHFIVADWLGINGTRWAIILPGMVAPFGVFLMRQFLRGLTRDYIEAAQIDGVGHLGCICWVVAPLLKPALAALMMLIFIENWNLVEQPLIFLNDIAQEPLSVYLVRMAGQVDLIFAASFFYLLPTALVFLYGQEFMVEGIQLSGVK
ncbi:MAG: carbohydrate ABC transporter permease [Defluviitaleaceae bacterium]|nr:carbohydrate ABC transporter permease [Defluviitaleaceae bacterium]